MLLVVVSVVNKQQLKVRVLCIVPTILKSIFVVVVLKTKESKIIMFKITTHLWTDDGLKNQLGAVVVYGGGGVVISTLSIFSVEL